MKKKEKSRWELGCFDTFESPFLEELHKIRMRQAKKTKGLSPEELVEHIKSQAEKVKKHRGRAK